MNNKASTSVTCCGTEKVFVIQLEARNKGGEWRKNLSTDPKIFSFSLACFGGILKGAPTRHLIKDSSQSWLSSSRIFMLSHGNHCWGFCAAAAAASRQKR
jgi:hypothetical protein